MSDKVTCPRCGGSGRKLTFRDGESDCPACGGSGVLRLGDVVDDDDNLIHRDDE